MSSNTKKSFLVYYDNEIIVCRLTDDEAGKLFKSLFPYGRDRIRPDFESSPALAMAFDVLSLATEKQLDFMQHDPAYCGIKFPEGNVKLKKDPYVKKGR